MSYSNLDDLKHQLLGKAVNYIGPDTQEVEPAVMTKLDYTRLDCLWILLNALKSSKIDGDIVEAGVWRGGAAIWMAAIGRELRTIRSIWCCDTYTGFPEGSWPHVKGNLSSSLIEVQGHINNLLGNSNEFRFLVGDFHDTLPGEIGNIALLHFDGDSLRATNTVLDVLYKKVVAGGYVVIDDYCLPECRKALHSWLDKHNIRPKLMNPYTGKELQPNDPGHHRLHTRPCGVWWQV